MNPWLKPARDGTFLLRVHVVPGARRTNLAGVHGDRLKIRLQAPPVDGKANRALVDYLADHLNLPRSGITLQTGTTSRDKDLRLAIDNPDRIRQLLNPEPPPSP
ncbi:MAG: hypothetical protein A2498_13745 [Lentisphaerae bacterium RIFOXYC12_FULL_60_16]|nr:MAG: hypothetical protein A2498_13745 [Lentisphaerae bacterium RIFOXYC12_FULL_60_16]